ncbi:membrane protein [Endozoicomonas numazuensis]|uniref:Membrane protein n=2 Tax=Endozoicomonas numazuensis TaxID=1137799 RepID=A0A081MZZ9_9GAMM|nr:membrane protein [Endozoicomonas numazuensis]
MVKALILAAVSSTAIAEDFKPNFSLILDGHYKSSNSALSEYEKGFGLGHVELGVSAAIDDLFYGKFTGVVHEHDNKTEFETEEAFIQTLALPGGFSVRAGRFLSDIGYLNGQHTHSDSFVERPAVYRAMLGSHYYDDGVRLNYVMPTDTFWTIGTEAFGGNKMRAQGLNDPKSVGVYTAFTKIGGDFNEENSWQLGLSYLRNENGASMTSGHDEHDHHDEHSHSHDHSHSHSHDHGNAHSHSHDAQFTGKNTYIAEAVWKWAPDGNYKYQNLTLSGEYLQAEDISETIKGNQKNEGFYLSSVFQMTSQWAVGARYGEFKGYEAHGDHFHEQKLKESEFMVSWSHSHFSTVRLQYTRQTGDGFENIKNDIVTLQYVMSLGAHDAHTF